MMEQMYRNHLIRRMGKNYCYYMFYIVLSMYFISIYGSKCQDGYVKHNKTGRCVACDVGEYHNKEYDMCVPCSFGKYSYKRASTNCVKCHRKYSTTHYMLGATGCNQSSIMKFMDDVMKYVTIQGQHVLNYVISFM